MQVDSLLFAEKDNFPPQVVQNPIAVPFRAYAVNLDGEVFRLARAAPRHARHSHQRRPAEDEFRLLSDLFQPTVDGFLQFLQPQRSGYRNILPSASAS